MSSSVVLDVDHLGDLCGNDCLRMVRRVQAVSGTEQGTDHPKVVIGGLVHDRDQQVACKECRKLLVRHPATVAVLQATPGSREQDPYATSPGPCRNLGGTVGQAGCPPRWTRPAPARPLSSSCSSVAAPRRSSHAWQRKTSRRAGACRARNSAVRRRGVKARTWSAV